MHKLVLFLFYFACISINGNAASLENFGNVFLSSFADIRVNVTNVSASCNADLTDYLEAVVTLNLTNENMWALSMLDATAKIPEGVLMGSISDLGNFDECLAVEHPTGRFSGKYCMIQHPAATTIMRKSKSRASSNFITELRKKKLARGNSMLAALMISYGVCIPSSCSAEDLNVLFQNNKLTQSATIQADENNCYTNETKDWSGGSWALISVGICLLVCVGISTAYESYQIFYAKNGKPNRLLSAFSLYSNTREMIEIRDSSGEMGCLHGIRTFSMMWVLLCHVYISRTAAPVINLIQEVQVMSDINYAVIVNGFFSVDSFFFLSGLLVAFVFFRNISKKGSFDAPLSYIHRYLRLTPGFLIMILFNITMLTELSNGPLYYKTTILDKTVCEENWWSSLLYLQNYIKPLGTCLGQSWYLSADMQMFWLAPLILYPLYLWPKIGVACLGLLTLVATMGTFAQAYVNEYKASMLMMTNFDQFKYDYVATHARMAPWLVGIALGFAICAIKGNKINVRLTKTKVVAGWLLSAGICLGCIYGIHRFQQVPNTSTILENAIYLSFVRLGWGIGLAWVVFACIHGYGGIINTFLSLGIFQPLGKLSYNVYLIHMTIISYRTAVLRTNVYYSDLDAVFEFLGTLVLAYLFAIVMYLTVEAPIAVLDRTLLSSISILPYPKPKPPSKQTYSIGNLKKVEQQA